MYAEQNKAFYTVSLHGGLFSVQSILSTHSWLVDYSFWVSRLHNQQNAVCNKLMQHNIFMVKLTSCYLCQLCKHPLILH